MRRLTVMAGALCFALATGTAALAQVPPDPNNPNENVPETMSPTPYGESINIETAKKVAAAAVAELQKRNWKGMCISVVDTHGELVYFHKMDNTQQGSVTISQNKARTAARFRRPTQIFSNAMQTPAGAYVATLDSPPPTASPGGIPLIEGGKIIGAVGCSGAMGDQDAVACKAGADTVK